MVEARRRAEWDRTAWLCHAIVNSAPFRDGPPVTAAECNPLLDDASRPSSGINCLDPAAVAAYHDAIQYRHERTTRTRD